MNVGATGAVQAGWQHSAELNSHSPPLRYQWCSRNVSDRMFTGGHAALLAAAY